MASGDDLGTVPDERGDFLEAILWGGVFLFTLVLFFWEFGLGAMESGEGVLQPIGTITEFGQTMWLSGLVGGGGVVALIVFAVIRYASGVRVRPAAMSPGQGTLKFAVFVLAVLAIVSTTIFVGAGTLAQTDEASAAKAAEMHGVDREVEMSVLASQWFWRFDVEGVPTAQGERVVLPADTVIQFETTSADVIHSFAIKHLGVTKDAFPGEVNTAWFYVGEVHGETDLTFTTTGGETRTVAADTYEVHCAELCGRGHSTMLATMYVISPENYESWVEAQGGNPENAFSVPDAGIQVGNVTAPSADGHEEEGDGHSTESSEGGDH